jgi:hypothetical protein
MAVPRRLAEAAARPLAPIVHRSCELRAPTGVRAPSLPADALWSRLGSFQCPPQLSPGRDAELRVDAVEVRGDRPVRQKQLLSDLTIGESVCGHSRDLELLRRELPAKIDTARSRSLSGRAELLRRPLNPGNGAEPVELLPCRTQRPP